jgi:hypothetical protein
VICIFFLLAENKEESKIVNGSYDVYRLGYDGSTLAMLCFFGEAILEARNC